MQILIKITITLAIILLATGIGKKFPSLAGLIAVMPLTGALVLVWLYLENKSDPQIMQEYTRGAIFGIIPSILFFIVAFICFKREMSLTITLSLSFATWLIAGFAHQWLLR